MGSTYNAHCNACQHDYVLHKGGGWTAYSKICRECGHEISVPRLGPANIHRLMTEDEIKHHLATKSAWTRKGGRFEDAENKLIDRLTGTCDCGGEMIPAWDSRIVYRCPVCKSSNLKFQIGDITYD